MKIKVDVASYDDCRDSLMEFRNANRETSIDATYFDWRYRGRPNGRVAITVWARDSRGTNIGALSLIPHRFWIDGTEQLVGILGDISVSPTWRGKGVAQEMLYYLIDLTEVNNLAGCFVLPNDGAARPLQKAGWNRVAEIRRFVTPTDVMAAVTRKIPGLFGTAIAQIGNWTARTFRTHSLRQAEADYVYRLTDAIDERFDELWARTHKRNVIMGARDRGYLVWRYLQHPVEKYHVVTLERDGTLFGYVVFRLQQGRCFIDDFLCLQWEDEIWRVITFFVEWARMQFEIASVSIRGSACALGQRSLLTRGWIKRRDMQLVMYRSNNIPGQGEPKFARWFVSAGDKDV